MVYTVSRLNQSGSKTVPPEMFYFMKNDSDDRQIRRQNQRTMNMSMISNVETPRMTHYGYSCTSPYRLYRRRKYPTFQLALVYISFLSNFSVASKPRVTRSHYSSSYDDLRTYIKRKRVQRTDSSDSSSRQDHGYDLDKYSLDSSSDFSDNDYDILNDKESFDEQNIDITSSVRRYQLLNDEMFQSDSKNRSIDPKIAHVYSGASAFSRSKSFDHRSSVDFTSPSAAQNESELHVDNREVQRLLRLSCSLSLCHVTRRNYDTTDHKEALPGTSVSTYIDTGATHTVLTYSAARRAGIAHLIDSRYSGQASGVAGISCRVLGRIPPNTVSFIFQLGDGKSVSLEQSPAIMVLEDNFNQRESGENVDMLIGLDLLEEWQATICLRSRDLRVRRRKKSHHHIGRDDEIIIPFFAGNDSHDSVTYLKGDCHDHRVHDVAKGIFSYTDNDSPLPTTRSKTGETTFVRKQYGTHLGDSRSTVLQTRGGKIRSDISSLSHSNEIEDVGNDIYDNYSDEDLSDDSSCDMSGV